MSPSADEIRAQLDRILASDSFANAGRVSRLLRYVVERTLAGERDQLKEYVLGVEVFDRSDTYDPRIDSIVRVEARRLRAKLEDYYQGPGAADPVVITMVRGGYVPVFAQPVAREIAAATSTTSAGPTTPHASKLTRWLALAAIVGAIVAIVIAGRWALPGLTGSEASSGIRVAVLPFAHFSTEPDVAMVAARVTDGVTSNLARVRELSVVSRTSAAQFTSEQRPVREVTTALNADIVMEGSVVVEAGGIHVVARLVDSVIDRKVWVSEYDSPPDQIADLTRRIAAQAAATVIKIRTPRP